MIAKDKAVPWQSTAASYAGLVAAYLCLHYTVNLTSKWILSASTGYGFMFPLALTCCHLAFGFLVLLPHMLSKAMRGTHRETILVQWKGLTASGLLMAANMGFNNTSLVNMSLSLNQIIRSSIPVCTAIALVVLEHQVPASAGEAGALLVLTAGVMLAVYEGTAAGSPWAVFCAVAGAISNAVMLATSARLLSERLDALRLLFYTAPVSLAALLPLYLWREAEQMAKFWAIHGRDVVTLLLASSCMALGYNLVHSLVMVHTSATATTVMGEAKLIGLTVLAYFILGEKMIYTPNMAAGCAMAITGYCLYSHCRLHTSQSKAGREEGAVEHDVEARPLITAPGIRLPSARQAPGRRM